MKFAGIDPGKSGAVVILHEDNSITSFIVPIIGTKEVDRKELSRIIREELGTENILVGLEDVHSIVGTAAAANFQFGWIKGLKEGLLSAYGVPHVLVAPKTWQKIIWSGIPNMKKPNGKNDTKSMTLLAMQRFFPNESFLATERSKVPHEGIIDAAAIAKYMQIVYGKK